MPSRRRWRDLSRVTGVVRAVVGKDSPMRLIDAVYENRVLSRWAVLLPRPASGIGATHEADAGFVAPPPPPPASAIWSIHEADAEFVPLDKARWLAVKVDTVAEEIVAGLYTDPATAGRIETLSVLSDL